MADEMDSYIKGLEDQNQKANNKINDLAAGYSSFQGNENANLIEYQLDTGSMLEKIEHFLRGDFIDRDEEGNEYWAKQLNADLVLFNDYGVNSIMLIIGNYVDKNTILSTYDEMRINEILADLGDELANFIFCNYEVMGMDTDFKKTRFQLTVLTILHTIESAYRRAIRGQTREDLNSAKVFTQSDHIMPLGRQNKTPQKKNFNLFKPSTWT